MSDWESACDPVPVKKRKGFKLPDFKSRRAAKKGGAVMKAKAREKLVKDALSVDFSKPYGKGV